MFILSREGTNPRQSKNCMLSFDIPCNIVPDSEPILVDMAFNALWAKTSGEGLNGVGLLMVEDQAPVNAFVWTAPGARLIMSIGCDEYSIWSWRVNELINDLVGPYTDT